MNEEKEELKQQLEKLQKQLVLSNNQVSSARCLWEPQVHSKCVRSVCPQCQSPHAQLRAGAVREQDGQRWFYCCLSLPGHPL